MDMNSVDNMKKQMMAQKINAGDEVLFEDNKSLEEIVQEIADEEGMSFDQAMNMFRKGLKEANNFKKIDPKKKAKTKVKRKLTKASRKKNR
jgi:hypothetical protein